MADDGLQLRGSLRIVIERAGQADTEIHARNLMMNQGSQIVLAAIIPASVGGSAFGINQAVIGHATNLFTGTQDVQFGSSSVAPTTSDIQCGAPGFAPSGRQIFLSFSTTNVTALSSNPPNMSFSGQLNLTNFSSLSYNYPMTFAEAALVAYLNLYGNFTYVPGFICHSTFATTQILSADVINMTWTISG